MIFREAFALTASLACLASCGKPSVSPTQSGGSTSAPQLAAASCTDGIFRETTRTGAVDFSRTPGVLRIRNAEVDADSIRRSAQGGTPIALNLFPDACYEAVATTVEREGEKLVLTAAIQGAPEGSRATLVLDGHVLVGSVDAPGPAFYQVRYAGNGVHALLRINPAVYPPD